MEETFDIDLLMKKTHPSTVVDVGAFSGNFTKDILEQSPECDCVMFEANPNCENNLEKVGVPYHITALSDSKREDVSFYIRDGYITCTGASLYKETTEEYKDARIMKVNTSTLDEYELYPDGIDLLKCDVQGSELDVLKGAEETLKRTKNILLECSLIEYNENAPQIEEVVQYLKEKGFYPNEIIGKHSNDDTVAQLDILFNDTVNHDVLKYISCQRDLKVEVISLKDREDRRKLFDAANKDKVGYSYFNSVNGKEILYPKLKEMGFDCKHDWVDPIHGTKLTKGEVGCYLSHYQLWLKCIEYNEPILILEDDAVLTDRFSVPEIYAQLNNNVNLLYLGWKEMGTSQPVNEQFVVPDYPYWGLAYVVTPDAAEILIQNKTIIPVDEYLPKRMKDLRPLAYKENVVETRPRSETGSNIFLQSRYDAYLDFNVTALTVGTDESKCYHLMQSSGYNGINFINLGKGKNWEGGVMENGKGGGHKINLIKSTLEGLAPDDVVLFCDGYDVFVNDTIDEFCYRYKEIGRKVIFGAERICWPDESNATLQEQLTTKQHPELDTPYKYLNSGTFIGRVSELKRIFSSPISNDDDDQLYCQRAYLSEQYDMCIDTDNYIFQCHDDDVVKDKNGMLYNPNTRCFNLCYHGNGGFNAKNKFNQLYKEFYGSPSPIVYIPTHDYEKLSDDILLIDFLTESMCDSLIELSEANGRYKNDVGDKVPGQEIRLKELDLLEGLSYHWERTVAPIIDSEFLTCPYYGMRDAFIIKYTMNGQRELPLHSDASLVTGSIKLNDDYTGGELYYPRQELKNTDIPVGKCILFPGQVSHPHQSLELKSGTKWSLTIWTKRQWKD